MQIAILSFFIILRPTTKNIFEVEEGKFLYQNLIKMVTIPVTTTDHKTGEVLMQGYMTESL